MFHADWIKSASNRKEKNVPNRSRNRFWDSVKYSLFYRSECVSIFLCGVHCASAYNRLFLFQFKFFFLCSLSVFSFFYIRFRNPNTTKYMLWLAHLKSRTIVRRWIFFLSLYMSLCCCYCCRCYFFRCRFVCIWRVQHKCTM